MLFEEVTERSGIAFQHFTGATGEKYMPETLASGVCAFDFDGDHLPDLYFVNGAPLGKATATPPPIDRLYRNRGDGTFQDVTGTALPGDPGYGIGCAVGDVDGDGWEDLYVANFGANALYRN
ncbi:MAG: VCBS repeat-containing protein, partial [candidate division NC10 bacterium]|nr:VCBS repeat-containing protein [candidate division NC10 bacterium]